MKMFRASYDGNKEDEFFYSGDNYNKCDKDVIGEAKEYGDLIELWEVDQHNECFNNMRLVWH